MRKINKDLAGCEVYVIFDGDMVWVNEDRMYAINPEMDSVVAANVNNIKGDDFCIETEDHSGYWVMCDRNCEADKKYFKAKAMHDFLFKKDDDVEAPVSNLYFAIGPSFNGNKHAVPSDTLIYHKCQKVGDLTDRSSSGIQKWLRKHPGVYGLIFYSETGVEAKILRTDVDLRWPQI